MAIANVTEKKTLSWTEWKKGGFISWTHVLEMNFFLLDIKQSENFQLLIAPQQFFSGFDLKSVD